MIGGGGEEKKKDGDALRGFRREARSAPQRRRGSGSGNAGWLRRPRDLLRLVFDFRSLIYSLFRGGVEECGETLLFNLLYISDNIRQVFPMSFNTNQERLSGSCSYFEKKKKKYLSEEKKAAKN